MWFLDMQKFLQAAEEAEHAGNENGSSKSRVIRLLMGDEAFLSSLTLKDIADIINLDAPVVFHEYEKFTLSPQQMSDLEAAAYMGRRRIL